MAPVSKIKKTQNAETDSVCSIHYCMFILPFKQPFSEVYGTARLGHPALSGLCISSETSLVKLMMIVIIIIIIINKDQKPCLAPAL